MGAPRLLIVGGSGRIGRLLARAWDAVPPPLAPLWQWRGPHRAGSGGPDHVAEGPTGNEGGASPHRATMEAGTSRDHEAMADGLARRPYAVGPDQGRNIADELPAGAPRAGPGPDALLWSPLAGGAGALRALDGPPAAMLVLAGVVPGPGADLSLNPALARACLAAAREAGIPRVLYASSSAVYGTASARPYAEDDPPRPESAYGHAKLEAEEACAAFRDAGLEVCALRIGNVFGADAIMRNAARLAPDEALAIDRFADGGGPERSYIGPATLARVLGALAADPGPLPEVLNIAAPGRVAMADLATAAGLRWRWTPAPDTAAQHVLLDCAALARRVAFAARDGTAGGMAAELAALPERVVA